MNMDTPQKRGAIERCQTESLRHPWWSTRGTRSTRGSTTWSPTRAGTLLRRTVLESKPRRRSSVLSRLARPIPHNLGVDSAGHTVVELRIQFGKLVARVDASLRDSPDSSSLHNVPDHELPDRLVLGDALRAVGATDILDVAPAVLVTSVVPPLRSHLLL